MPIPEMKCRLFGHYPHPGWGELCGRCGHVGPEVLRMQWCERRQCRGRIPHSWVQHWFGWWRR